MKDDQAEQPYVSTGRLPPPGLVGSLVAEAHARCAATEGGELSQTYPTLANAPRGLFGVCVVGVDGTAYSAGDAGHEFSIMSVSKPFVFALVCQALGAAEARSRPASTRGRASGSTTSACLARAASRVAS